jgi:hypothetical protein
MATVYLYLVYLEEEIFLAEYPSTHEPPEVGQIININYSGTSESFKVVAVGTHTSPGHQVIVLIVKRAAS